MLGGISALQVFGFLSVLISFPAYIVYIRDIIRGETQPERASWFIWLCLGGIAIASQAAKGATDSLWYTVAQTAGVVIVFFLSLWRGKGGLVRRDIVGLTIAGLGLILWYITREAGYALCIVVLVDSVGAILTAIKSYQEPETETLATWSMYAVGAAFSIAAVGKLDLMLLLYPCYIFLADSAIGVAILLGRKAGR